MSSLRPNTSFECMVKPEPQDETESAFAEAGLQLNCTSDTCKKEDKFKTEFSHTNLKLNSVFPSCSVIENVPDALNDEPFTVEEMAILDVNKRIQDYFLKLNQLPLGITMEAPKAFGCSEENVPKNKKDMSFHIEDLLAFEVNRRFQECFLKLNQLPLSINMGESRQYVCIEEEGTSSDAENPKSDLLETDKESAAAQDEFLENGKREGEAYPNKEKLKPYMCAECDSVFIRKNHLSQHVLLVHENKKPHKCSDCDGVYSRKFNLSRHIVSVHKKIKPHQCPDCDSSFSHKNQLSMHNILIHGDKKTYKCLDCECDFNQKDLLSQHILISHGEKKPFKCLECDSAYSRKFNLSRHIQSVHKKIKPHKCSDCESSFSLKNHLSRHILSVHENKKPFKCFDCDSAFNRKEHLSQHSLLVHQSKITEVLKM